MKNKIKKYESIDYDFRTGSYFDELNDLKRLLLKNVKGAFRRNIDPGYYEMVIKEIRNVS